MTEEQRTEDEKSAPKGFWGRVKETWNILAPIYKDAIRHDRKRFFRIGAIKLGVAALWGGVAPWVSGFALNVANAAVATKAVTGTALAMAGLQRLLNISDRILGRFEMTLQDEFNYSGRRHRGLQRTKEAANIPESARGQKNPKELSRYALQNAEHEMSLLNNTTNLAFYVPALALGITQAFICNPLIGAAVTASICINSYLSYRTAQKNQGNREEFIQYDTKFQAQQNDVLEHQTRVTALGRQEEEYEDLKEISEKTKEAQHRGNKQKLKSSILQDIIEGITITGLGIWACYYAIKTGDLGAMAILNTATNVATFSGMRMTQEIGNMRENLGKWYSTKKALSYERSSHDLHYGDRTPENVQGRLTVQNMSYTYEGRVHPALRDINLSLGHGLTVITGPSGGGKSTLLALLQHRREGEGEVLLDGVPVTELPKGFLESQTTIVEQMPSFFEQRTVGENMASVRTNVAEGDIRQALQSVGLYGELEHGGISLKLSELSGGQQQRENLAEAVVRQTPIMIFDEPTSRLNQANRRRNWKNLLRLSQDHTVIVVSHNAQEIESADRVITVESGRITQDGTPAELASKRGYIRSLLKDSRRPLRTTQKDDGVQQLAALRREAYVGQPPKKKSQQKRRLEYVLTPGIAHQLMVATTISDVDVAVVRAKIEEFKKRQNRRS